MSAEHRIAIAVAPGVVFAIYRDVGHWRTWDRDSKRAALDGLPVALARLEALAEARSARDSWEVSPRLGSSPRTAP